MTHQYNLLGENQWHAACVHKMGAEHCHTSLAQRGCTLFVLPKLNIDLSHRKDANGQGAHRTMFGELANARAPSPLRSFCRRSTIDSSVLVVEYPKRSLFCGWNEAEVTTWTDCIGDISVIHACPCIQRKKNTPITSLSPAVKM